MNSVELIKKICKERKIPVSKLEKECGFSNGYLSSLKKGVLPSDRLKKVADYLHLDVEYLSTGVQSDSQPSYYFDDETAMLAQELFDNKELRALFDVQRGMSADDLQALFGMALALKRKEKGTDDDSGC